MISIDENTIKENRIKYDRIHKIPESRNSIINRICDECDIEYDYVMLNLPSYISRLSSKQSRFMKEVIFNQVPLFDLSREYHMSLNKTIVYYNKALDKLIKIIKERNNQWVNNV